MKKILLFLVSTDFEFNQGNMMEFGALIKKVLPKAKYGKCGILASRSVGPLALAETLIQFLPLPAGNLKSFAKPGIVGLDTPKKIINALTTEISGQIGSKNDVLIIITYSNSDMLLTFGDKIKCLEGTKTSGNNFDFKRIFLK